MTDAMPDPDLVALRAALAFYDRQTLALPRPMTPAEVWNQTNARPLPLLRLAFRVRDAISARFGVARIGGFSGRRIAEPKAGDRMDFFLVERSAPGILTLSARDRHLETITCVTTSAGAVAITSSVVIRNAFGRLYMIPVAPAHRLIVWLMLRRLGRALRAEGDQAG